MPKPFITILVKCKQRILTSSTLCTLTRMADYVMCFGRMPKVKRCINHLGMLLLLTQLAVSIGPCEPGLPCASLAHIKNFGLWLGGPEMISTFLCKPNSCKENWLRAWPKLMKSGPIRPDFKLLFLQKKKKRKKKKVRGLGLGLNIHYFYLNLITILFHIFHTK